MNEAQRKQVESVLGQALAQPPAKRLAFLDEICGDDDLLRKEILSRLSLDEETREYTVDFDPVERKYVHIPHETGRTYTNSLIGQSVSHYRVVDQIGRGGMGLVYRALDNRLDRLVALKFLPPELSRDTEAKTRLTLEAKSLSALDHPNICTIYDIGETQEGHTYIAMAFYEGETLKEKIARGPLSVEETIVYAVRMADGLRAAHGRGIIHRDFKPANVMVTTDGQVKLLDFGLAKLSAMHITKTGSTMGTMAYMSPEQARGDVTDQRTDLWSFGVVLYEMLTGVRPFKGEHEQAVLYAILNEDPEPANSLRREIPARMVQVLEILLRKNPSGRYLHTHELLIDLKTIHTGLIAGTKTPEKSSIAVLPFENMSADVEQDYFCDGLAEELINALTKLNNLRVVARTSAFAFKGKHMDVREIGRQLQVDSILEGSVRRAGNRLRITVQLINVADGYHLWSERFDRVMEDVFAIQDEISLAIIEKLKVNVLDTEREALVKRHTENIEAYHLYLRGRYFWNERTEKALKRAIYYFEQAIQMDPLYALAHVGIADYYILLGVWGFIPATEASARVISAATTALEIDDDLADGYVSRGFWNALLNWDWPAADIDFERAIDLNPHHVQAHYWYGIFLGLMGRFEESFREMRRAIELDPLSLHANTFFGMVLCYSRRYDEAADLLSRVLEMDGNYFPAHLFTGVTFAAKARYDEAIASLSKAVALTDGTPSVVGHLGCVYAMGGLPAKANDMLEELRVLSMDRYVSPIWKAMIYAGLGDDEKAISNLEKARTQGDPFVVHARVTPFLDGLRRNPAFNAVMSRMRARS